VCIEEGVGCMSHVIDAGITSMGKWRFIIRWRDSTLHESTVKSIPEMQKYESSNQLITQLMDRIQQRAMSGQDKHGKLRVCSMNSVMGTKDIIHPESMAVHVSRASYRYRTGLLGYREWALTHPATRNPAPVVGTTWTAPVVGRAPRAAGRKVWDSFTQFYHGTLVHQWHRASACLSDEPCPGSGTEYEAFVTAVRHELKQLPASHDDDQTWWLQLNTGVAWAEIDSQSREGIVSGRADMRRVGSWVEGQLAMLRQQWVFHPTSHATRILLMDTHRARSHQSNKLSYQMVLRSKDCQHMYEHDDDR
jgi:hypothetical protein